MRLKKNKGILFWITGLSGSGKTTIGKKIKKDIVKLYGPTLLVSGDNLRKIFKFDKYTYSSSIVCHRHPKRDCLYKEAKVCMLLGMDEREIIRNQIRNYKELGMPKKDGLMHGGILLRHHKSQEICKLMEDWWSEINNHSIRDQLSLNFVAWSNEIKLNYVSEITLANN